MAQISEKKLFQFLRSGVLASKAAALEAISNVTYVAGLHVDGAPMAVRYTGEDGKVSTLFVIFYSASNDNVVTNYTIFENQTDIEKELAAIEKKVSDVVKADGLASGDTGISYSADTTAKYISGATSLTDADSKLNAAILSLSEQVDGLELSALTPTETNLSKKYALVNSKGETLGATIDIEKDKYLYTAVTGHIDDTITSETDPTIVEGTGAPALDLVFVNSEGKYVLTLIPISDLFSDDLYASGVTYDETAGKVVGVVDATTQKGANNVAFLTVGADGFKVDNISGATVKVGEYTSVEFPAELTGATPVESTDTISEALNAIETTVSALTSEVLVNEEVTEAAVEALATAAGTKDADGKIVYVVHTTDSILSGASCLDDADVALADAIRELEAEKSHSIVSGSSAITVTAVDVEGGAKNYKVAVDAKLDGKVATGTTDGKAGLYLDGEGDASKLDVNFDFGLVTL